MRTYRAAMITCILGAALLPAAAASAEGGNEARLREALRTATTQLREAEDARARLQASEAALKKELEAARAEAVTQKARAGARDQRDLKDRLGATTLKFEEQGETVRALGAALTKCQSDRDELFDARGSAKAAQDALLERVAAAERRSVRLFEVGKGILDWLSNLGFGAALAAREPFLGLKRVELENAAQAHEDKLLEARGSTGGAP
jgi:chromosome segregation ATPase